MDSAKVTAKFVGAALIVVVIGFIVWLLAGPVHGREPICGDLKILIMVISEYGEIYERTWSEKGTTYSIFRNRNNGTWTKLRIEPTRACIVDIGQEKSL